jgi:DNA polymerase III epsilon subunit-like protein
MAFEQHCIVELMGHQRIAGKVSEAAVFGTTLMRVDVPKTAKREGFTKFYGPSAIYAITPVSEDIAQRMAESLDERPVEEWRLSTQPQIEAKIGPPILSEADYDDPYGDDTDDFDNFDDEEDEPERPIESDTEAQKRLAAEWARDLLARPDGFVVLDTETTGLNRDRNDEACQIAIVDQTGKVLLDTLVKPSISIDPGAAAIHGITEESVKDAPTFNELLPKLNAALGGRIVVIYNAEFDTAILGNMLAANGSGAESGNPIVFFGSLYSQCAMLEYARFHGDWNDWHGNYRWQKLTDGCRRLGVEITSAPEHSALGDALRTLGLIQKMAEFGAPAKVAEPEIKSGIPF